MKMKNLKLTAKLAISVASFMLPLGILLYSIISISLTSIQKDRLQLKGLEVLRPAAALMQIVPHYIRLSVDNTFGDIEHTREYTSALLAELDEKYTMFFDSEPRIVSMRTLAANWNHIENTRIQETVMWAYRELMNDLITLIAYVGDISGLITDRDLENNYLITSTIHELPQAQMRLVRIENILRTIETGAFTQRRRAELQLQMDLLIHSDNEKIQKRFRTIETFGIRRTESLDSFELLLRTCYDRIAYFSRVVEQVVDNAEIDVSLLPILYEISGQTNNAMYRLQTASIDRLETLITARMKTYWQRFIGSLIAAFLATALAFIIIFATMNYIRKSAFAISRIFRRLDRNDLSAQIEIMSQDEIGDLMKALNGFLYKLNTAFISFNKNAYMVTTAVLELSSSAKEITATANEQQASISEIVSTMQNNKDLSIQAAEKTDEVAQLAIHTQELSRRGADLREFNEGMMLDIRNQNVKIIDIIKNLADMLFRIDESIQLIDTIADRTKLIAFNAALEASSSGEAGSRFSVVAGEIRRFADNVVDSVSEIKEKISEIQDASQMLITEANNGSSAIDSGYNRMVEQKEVFDNIAEVSKSVAVRSQQISSLSKQQEMASLQVFTALKEISAGISQFVSSTSMTSATVEKLNKMSIELKETLAKYQTKERKE
jgi:methyl-accepting chemotaxis protein